MNGNVIRTITIRGTSEGLDKLQTDLTKLAAAHKNVAIAAEETDKATLSLEQAWKRQTLKLDEAARAQNNIARETKIANQMRHEEKISAEQLTDRLNLINQHYTRASTGAQTYGKALQQGTGEARLARHELINLSRQVQDVGVSLASGQSPLTVLVQQGSQIADVFATSSGTLRGFFSQAGAGAARFLGSFAGITTAAVGMGVAFATAGSSFASGQREIEKGLSGIGAASGVTRDQINAIGEASAASFGLSRSEALTTATAFASTGKIYAANVGQATKLIDDFAKSGGDAAEMTKTLGAALQDPAKGAMELNKAYGFLNVSTLENIRNLQAQGKAQEAQKALMDALTPAIQKQAELVGTWTKMWNRTANALSNIWTGLGKDLLQLGEQMSGVNLGGFSQEEQLGRAKERVSGLQGRIDAPRSKMQAAMPPEALQSMRDELKAAQEEVAQLEQALNNGAAAFNKLSTDALDAADGFMPLQAQIRQTQEQLAKLREYEAAGGYVDQNAIAAGQIRVQQLEQQNAALIRQNEYTAQLAALYPGMSIEIAKQLEQMNGQLQVAQARTGAEQMVAQQYVTQNNLLMQGKTLEEAMAVAAAQREIAEANVSRAIADQIHALEQQVQLSQASLNNTVEMTKAQQAYTNAIRQGASEMDAQALGQATLDAENQRAHEQRVQAYQQEQRALNNAGDEIQNNVRLTTQWYYVSEKLTREGWSIGQELKRAGDILRENIGMIREMEAASEYSGKAVTDAEADRLLHKKSLEDVWGKENVEEVIRGVGLDQYKDYQLKPSFLEDFNKITPIEPIVGKYLDSMGKLITSTNRLNDTMQNALSPFYSQDPRTTRLGFRAGTVGNPDWMTGATNANPLVAVLGAGATAPGMASGGSFTVGGGDSANDNRMAVFPVASGEEIVVNRNRERRGSQVINIDNRIIVNGSMDEDTMSRMKVSRYQQAQRMRAGMARA